MESCSVPLTNLSRSNKKQLSRADLRVPHNLYENKNKANRFTTCNLFERHNIDALFDHTRQQLSSSKWQRYTPKFTPQESDFVCLMEYLQDHSFGSG